jgi:hypothetical protein
LKKSHLVWSSANLSGFFIFGMLLDIVIVAQTSSLQTEQPGCPMSLTFEENHDRKMEDRKMEDRKIFTAFCCLGVGIF